MLSTFRFEMAEKYHTVVFDNIKFSFIAGGIFLSCQGTFESHFDLWDYTFINLNKSLSNDQSDCSILSHDHKFI